MAKAGYEPVDKPAVKKEKKKGPGQGWLLLFYANVFFACASFSIVVPTMYPYLTKDLLTQGRHVRESHPVTPRRPGTPPGAAAFRTPRHPVPHDDWGKRLSSTRSLTRFDLPVPV
jgi:hypothetical protein